MSFKPLSRRTMLRSAGTLLSLPFLEAMLPRTALAQSAKALRLVGWYLPNGYYRTTEGGGGLKDDWTPTGTGSSYTLSPILQPLAPYHGDIQVLTVSPTPPPRCRRSPVATPGGPAASSPASRRPPRE